MNVVERCFLGLLQIGHSGSRSADRQCILNMGARGFLGVRVSVPPHPRQVEDTEVFVKYALRFFYSELPSGSASQRPAFDVAFGKCRIIVPNDHLGWFKSCDLIHEFLGCVGTRFETAC